jgi:glutaredoxin
MYFGSHNMIILIKSEVWHMVKLYTLSTCPWCKKVKVYFTEKQIPYECIEVDLLKGKEQETAVEEVKKLVGDAVFPVTVIGGRAILGFKPEEFTEALSNVK